MDDIEGGIPNSDEVDEVIAPDEASAPAEEPAPDEAKRAKAHRDAFGDEAAPDNRSLYLAIGGVIGIPLIFLLLAWFEVMNFSTAIYVIGMGFIPLILWMGRMTNTVYVAFLGCILAALLTCLYCLWVMLAHYNFDVKASEAKQRVAMAQPVDCGLLAVADAIATSTFADC